MGKLINRIPGSRHLISSLQGLALRMHVESPSNPRDVKALPGKLDIKTLVFSISECGGGRTSPCHSL